jgi:hypothetical protein
VNVGGCGLDNSFLSCPLCGNKRFVYVHEKQGEVCYTRSFSLIRRDRHITCKLCEGKGAIVPEVHTAFILKYGDLNIFKVYLTDKDILECKALENGESL